MLRVRCRALIWTLLLVWGCETATLSVVRPEIEVSPEAVDFGAVPFGATKRQRVRIRNAGAAPLALRSVEASGIFVVAFAAMTLQGQQETTVDVAFTPVAAAAESGALVIVSNDPERPSVTMALDGSGAVGTLEVEPQAIDFQRIALGAAAAREFVVRNLGSQAVRGQIRTEGFGRPEHFDLVGAGSDFAVPADFNISPLMSSGFQLEYRPLLRGDDGGRIVFQTCGDRCGVELPITAFGADTTLVLEPQSVDFGSSGILESVTRDLTIRNLGTEPISIRSVASRDGPPFSLQSLALPQEIEPGGAIELRLQFAPTVAGTFDGLLTIGTDLRGVEEARVPLLGVAEGPLFEVLPEALAFGTLPQPGTHQRAFQMLNAGSTPVRVESVSFTGAPEFEVVVQSGLPATLDDGEAIIGAVRFTPTAEAMFTGTVAVQTDDPSRNEVLIPVSGAFSELACDLVFSPQRLNFGLVPPGGNRSLSAALRNRGAVGCVIESFELKAHTPTVFTVGAGLGASRPIAAGASIPLDFEYMPVDARESKARFVVTTDDPFFPERVIQLAGSSLFSTDILVAPNVLDFGVSRPGCSERARFVTVTNLGTVPAVVEVLSVSGAPEFSTSADALPVVVAPGAREAFRLGYTPGAVGTTEAEYTLQLRDGQFAFTIPASGRSEIAPAIVDRFAQRDEPKVDVLFVIDNSGSMFDEQQNLADNLDTFVGRARDWNADFQIGVTTTDLSAFGLGGQLVGPVLSDAAGVVTTFREQVMVGVLGSGFEMGLEAMAASFRLAADGEGFAANLYRADATTVVIIISDEDDSSLRPILEYLNELQTRSSVGSLFAAITGQREGCGTNFLDGAAAAPRYEEMVALTDGESGEICTDDWSRLLGDLGDAAFGLTDVFVLSQAAEPDSIEVRIDGITQSSSGYTYDARTTSVRFGRNSPPPAGSQIEIRYLPEC